MELDMVMTQEPMMTARADVVTILDELHDAPVQLDNQTVDRHYVDFAGIAQLLEECIEGPGTADH